jgi:Domain of unknown function (DUF4381)
MTPGRSVPLAVWLLLAPAVASAQTHTPPVQVSSSVDRTAVWVADRLTYVVDLVCAPGVDVLPDDLAKEKLRFNGLEIVSNDDSTTTDAAGETRHHLRYVLTTYRVDVPALSIEPLSIRYYAHKPGQRLQDLAPAGDVTIPGAAIAFRSTLPDAQQVYAIRDTMTPGARAWFFANTRQLGLAAVILSLAPAALVVAGFVRRRTRATAGTRSKRRARMDHRAALERLRTLDLATEEDRRRAYDEISAAVREYVAGHSHVSAAALTAGELADALDAGGGRLPRETVTSLLAACDVARYGPASAMPPADAGRDALATAEQLLTGKVARDAVPAS